MARDGSRPSCSKRLVWGHTRSVCWTFPFQKSNTHKQSRTRTKRPECERNEGKRSKRVLVRRCVGFTCGRQALIFACVEAEELMAHNNLITWSLRSQQKALAMCQQKQTEQTFLDDIINKKRKVRKRGAHVGVVGLQPFVSYKRTNQKRRGLGEEEW